MLETAAVSTTQATRARSLAPSARCPDVTERPVQVRARLCVDDDDARLPLGSFGDLRELGEHGVGALLGHHELGLEGEGGVLAAPLYGVRPEGEVRDEVAVHDVELDAVAAGVLEGLAVGAELG